MWQIQTGLGKSFIIATIALIALTIGVNTVYIITPTDALKNRDKDDFMHFFQQGVNEGKVNYRKDLNHKCKPGELIIVDEADYFMFNKPEAFFKYVREAEAIVCMTATGSDRNWLDKFILSESLRTFSY